MRGMRTLKLAAVAALITATAACGLDSAQVDESGNSQPKAAGYDPAKDVKMGKCEVGEYGEIPADVKITNNDDKPRSYMITAEAVDAKGNRVSELNAISNSVRPGQNVTSDATGYSDDESIESITCKLVSIDSFRD